MTRLNVLLIGLLVLVLGGVGYGAFTAAGFEDASAGIAAEAVLIVIVVVWTGSYLFRVVTGKMTYMEQRRRYRNGYDQLTDDELQAVAKRRQWSKRRVRHYVFGREGQPCFVCGTGIQRADLGGRRMFWCPSCQT